MPIKQHIRGEDNKKAATLKIVSQDLSNCGL